MSSFADALRMRDAITKTGRVSIVMIVTKLSLIELKGPRLYSLQSQFDVHANALGKQSLHLIVELK